MLFGLNTQGGVLTQELNIALGQPVRVVHADITQFTLDGGLDATVTVFVRDSRTFVPDESTFTSWRGTK